MDNLKLLTQENTSRSKFISNIFCMQTLIKSENAEEYCGTNYVAKLLKLSVGTVHKLVQSNVLEAWKTKGGHRRISMSSVRDYQIKNNMLSMLKESKSSRLSILLVENDASIRTLLLDYCNQFISPVDCTAMSSCCKALIEITKIKPDVLIIDFDMPDVDGFELLRVLRKKQQLTHMTTLVLSEMTSVDIEAQGGLREGTIFMQKPVNVHWFNGFLTGQCNELLAKQEYKLKITKIQRDIQHLNVVKLKSKYKLNISQELNKY